jgi:hypothetical protein
VRILYDSYGRELTNKRLAIDAWRWLPDWLEERLTHDRKPLGKRVFRASLISFLLSLPITALAALIFQLLLEAMVTWSNASNEVLGVFRHYLFYSTFAMTAFPVIWGCVGAFIFEQVSKDRLVLEYEELLREIAFRQGQDQGILRDEQGRYVGKPITTAWL